MKKKYLVHIFKSYYCKIVFLIFFVSSYFLIPRQVFYGWYMLLALAFMFTFSLTLTCLVRNTKEKILLAKTYKTSILSILATVFGISALQVCGIGAPVCGASVGVGVLSLIFPSFAVGVLDDWAVQIVLFSIVAQIISLYYLKCFKNMCVDGDNKTVDMLCE